MDDDDEFEREAALDAEDAAWENSDDDAPEEAPNGSGAAAAGPRRPGTRHGRWTRTA